MLLLEKEEFDFLTDYFDAKEVRKIKKEIMNAIIHTDMATMKDLRDKMKMHLDQRAIKDGVNSNLFVDTTSPQ